MRFTHVPLLRHGLPSSTHSFTEITKLVVFFLHQTQDENTELIITSHNINRSSKKKTIMSIFCYEQFQLIWANECKLEQTSTRSNKQHATSVCNKQGKNVEQRVFVSTNQFNCIGAMVQAFLSACNSSSDKTGKSETKCLELDARWICCVCMHSHSKRYNNHDNLVLHMIASEQMQRIWTLPRASSGKTLTPNNVR